MIKTKIFIAGATGYIGGAVVERLLKHSNARSFEITALVRSVEKAEILKNLGIIPVVGSFSDISLVGKLASSADIVLEAVDVNNLEAVKTILRGIRKRYQTTGKPPAFIRTSGMTFLADDAAGLHPTSKIWNDLDSDDLETVPDTAPHRNVDLAVINADNEKYVLGYIVVPAMVYGLATGKLVSTGVVNNRSKRIPGLIRASLRRGRAGMVGKGLNIWPNVHIDDVGDLYIAIFDAILANRGIGHGREGYYFGENGEHTLYDIGKSIGNSLVELKKSVDAEPTTFTKEEVERYFKTSTLLGSNSRCKGNRSRAIGWRPKKPPRDVFASIKPEVEEILRRG